MLLHPTIVHYQTGFDIESDSDHSFDTVLSIIREWLGEKTRNSPDLLGPWFVGGGKRVIEGRQFQTAAEVGTGSEAEPEMWSLQMIETDGRYWFRKWQTNISLRSSEHALRFYLSVGYSTIPSYIGPEAVVPPSSSPRVIRYLLDDEQLRVSTAGRRLGYQPIRLDTWDSIQLVNFIFDEGRRLPVVVAGIGYPADAPNFRVNLDKLALDLAGTALVFIPEDEIAMMALGKELPSSYKLRVDKIRVFPPGARIAEDMEGSQSRFFPLDHTEEAGANQISDMIVRGLARRPLFLRADDILSPRDVEEKSRSRQLQKALADVGEENWPKKEQLFRAEIDGLKAKLGDIESQSAYLLQDAIDNEAKVFTLEHDRAILDYAKQQATSERDRLREELKSVSAKADLATKNVLQPRSITEILARVETLFPAEVVFSPVAKKTAAKAACNDLYRAWDCVASIPSILHGLCFDGVERTAAAIASEFRKRSGYELAWTETGTTKNNSGIMASRKQQFEGREFDITAHIKLDGPSDSKRLRVHFDVDHDRNRIFVGHCGDHMDTSNTRNL